MQRRDLWAAVLLIAAAAPASAGDAPLELDLRKAIELALAPAGNARVQLAEESRAQARERSRQARAALLPNLEASLSQQSQTRNLEAFGIRFETTIPGFGIPASVGPFNVFDARATMTQTIFDFGAIRRHQASKAGIGAADAEAETVRDQVAQQAANLYLAALRAETGVEAARANVALAEELVQLATNQKTAGTGTGVEVTRARVQLSNEHQRLLVAENERRQAHLQLLKWIGLPLESELRLTEQLGYAKPEAPSPEEALGKAIEARADIRAQRKREAAARLNHSAVKMERLPSLVGFADYGSIGSSINHAIPTRTYGASLRLPLFDGGRREARRAESRSQYEQERIRTADLKRQVELEIRLALDNLRSSDEQVLVSREGLKQAEEELAQAQRRYEAGVASSIEVTDAQTRLARARDNHIAALFLFNKAGIDLRQAMGTVRGLLH